MPDDILDLDAIAPESKKIKFNGKIITVNPPRMGELMVMVKLGRKLQDADPNTTDYEPIVEEMKGILYKVIPELEGNDLSISQLIALETLIAQMATLPQTAETTTETTEEKKT